MTLKYDQRHRRFAALAVLALIALSFVSPLFFTNAPNDGLFHGAEVHAAAQGSFTLSEPLKILSDPPILVRGGVLQLAQPKNAAPLPSRQQADLIAAGTGILLLKDADVLVGGQDAIDFVEPEGPKAPLLQALSSGSYQSLLIESSDIELSTGQKSSIRMTDASLRIKPVPGERATVQGAFQVLGRKVSVSATLGLSEQDVAKKEIPVRGSIGSAMLFKSSFSGVLAFGNGRQLKANSAYFEIEDTPVFARWLGFAWPNQLKLNTLHAEGPFEWDGGVLKIPDGQFRLDRNTAAGSVIVNARGKRPLIDGTLAFQRLDATSLVELDEQNTADLIAATVRTTADWLPDGIRRLLTDMRLPILRQIDLDLRASAVTTVVGEQEFNQTAAALSLHDGQLFVDLPDLKLPSGGQGSIQVTVDTKRAIPKCSVRSTLSGVKIEALAGELFPYQLVSGPADVSVDIRGDWSTPEAFIRSMDGSIDVRMENGALLAANLTALFNGIERDAAPSTGWQRAVLSGNTGLTSLVGSLNFTRGVAHISELSAMQNSNQEVLVTGSFDVHERSLDLYVIPGDTTAARDGPAQEDVFTINGAWDSPLLTRRSVESRAQSPQQGAAPHSASDTAAANRG